MAAGLTNVGGKMYMYLAKSSILLRTSLAKVPTRKRPLAKTIMFECIGKARNDKYKELVKDAATEPLGAPESTCQVVVRDPCDALGLDADSVSALSLGEDQPPPGGNP